MFALREADVAHVFHPGASREEIVSAVSGLVEQARLAAET